MRYPQLPLIAVLLLSGCQVFETGGLPKQGKPTGRSSLTDAGPADGAGAIPGEHQQSSSTSADPETTSNDATHGSSTAAEQQLAQTQQAFAETIERIAVLDQKLNQMLTSVSELEADVARQQTEDENSAQTESAAELKQKLEEVHGQLAGIQAKLEQLESRPAASDAVSPPDEEIRLQAQLAGILAGRDPSDVPAPPADAQAATQEEMELISRKLDGILEELGIASAAESGRRTESVEVAEGEWTGESLSDLDEIQSKLNRIIIQLTQRSSVDPAFVDFPESGGRPAAPAADPTVFRRALGN